jgi:pimeloyl-ACP methyl ester carboxylesterase
MNPTPTTAPSARPAPSLRRAYFDCRYGQLHVYQAIPAGGGFDEATAVMCIPGAPGSGSYFQPLLVPLGHDRSVYAIDVPGQGLSDPPPVGAGAAEIAAALADFLGSMRIRRINLIAAADGAAVALQLAQQQPVLVGRLAFAGAAPATREALHLPPEAGWPANAVRVREFFDSD